MTLIRTADRFYPSLLNQLFNRELVDWNNNGFSAEDSTLPAVNILEDENRIQIEVAAPGMKKDDFKIELDQNRLTVSAESEKENIANQGNAIHAKSFAIILSADSSIFRLKPSTGIRFMLPTMMGF